MLVTGFSVTLTIQAEWISCGPSDAFSVQSVVFDPKDPDTGYAVGACSSMADGFAAWRTEDGARTWHPLIIENAPVETLQINPEQIGSVYALASGTSFRSDDRGKNWTRLGRIQNRNSRLTAFDLTVDSQSPQILYAALGLQASNQDGEVVKSRDGGKSWQPSGLAGKIVYDIEFVSDQTGTLYAATSDGLFITVNGGGTWMEVGPPGIESRHMTVAVDPIDPIHILVGTAGNGIYVTSDGGRSWNSSSEGIGRQSIYSIRFDPADSHVVWAGCSGCGIFRSINSGKTWTHMNPGSRYQWTRYLNILPGRPSTVFFTAERGGIWRWIE